jgi:hypothetical protein
MGNTLSSLLARAACSNADSSLVQQLEPNNECTFLGKLPLEVRRQIYKYLLVNPMLE